MRIAKARRVLRDLSPCFFFQLVRRRPYGDVQWGSALPWPARPKGLPCSTLIHAPLHGTAESRKLLATMCLRLRGGALACSKSISVSPLVFESLCLPWQPRQQNITPACAISRAPPPRKATDSHPYDMRPEGAPTERAVRLSSLSLELLPTRPRAGCQAQCDELGELGGLCLVSCMSAKSAGTVCVCVHVRRSCLCASVSVSCSLSVFSKVFLPHA